MSFSGRLFASSQLHAEVRLGGVLVVGLLQLQEDNDDNHCHYRHHRNVSAGQTAAGTEQRHVVHSISFYPQVVPAMSPWMVLPPAFSKEASSPTMVPDL